MTTDLRPWPKILLVHNGNSVSVYLTFLNTAGVLAEEAHAPEALARALALRPDLIVLDFDCDGEVIAALQSDARTRHIPVIALADVPTQRWEGHLDPPEGSA